MTSAYPSCQSFFDASSDSIRATDVEKCRISSFSSLSDLFARNPNGKSELFSNVRTPVFVPAEVTFPSRKSRECEDRVVEKVSLWHEWGSGECPGEESSGLLSDMFKMSSSELFRSPSSNLFPNLGSANVSMVPEEFTFPERRKREDESWRERRGFMQDWVPDVPTVDNNVRESTVMISSVVDFLVKNPAKPSNLISSTKPSLFSNLETPVGSKAEFPARKKRDENPFWKDYSSCADAITSECVPSSPSTSGVNSLSGLYSKSPSSKCSSLFSNLGTINVNSDEVVFPSRKKNPDRNAWRDWSNTGYSDWAEDDSEDQMSENDGHPAQEVSIALADKSRALARPLQSTVAWKHKMDNSGSTPEVVSSVSSTQNFTRSHLEVTQSTGVEASRIPSGYCSGGRRVAGKVDDRCEALDSAGHNSEWSTRNAERSSARADGNRSSETRKQVCRDVVRNEVDEDEDDVHAEEMYRSSRRELHEQRISRQKIHSFPPPLGFLGRQCTRRTPHHVPWVQLQPVRSEGRFMLQEVKVTQPVVFEPIREQGRLVLQLIRQDDSGEPTGRHAHGPQIANGDSNIKVQEQISGHADEDLEVEEKHRSDSSVDRELGEEKLRKAVKSSKVYPEGCLLRNCEVSKTISTQAVEKELVSTGVGKTPEEREPMKRTMTTTALSDMADGSSENCGASLLDQGWQDGSNVQNPSGFKSEKVADNGGNEEIPVLFAREVEAASQSLPFWNPVSTKLRDSDPQVQCKSAFRSCIPRNGMSTESGLLLLPSLHRSQSIRNIALSEFGRVEGEKGEANKERWRGREEDCFEPRSPFVSSGQGFDGTLGVQATTPHFLHWVLRKRPEAPGDPDPARLTNYPPLAASFLCADGVGKRHHEKSFWEQPCVS